METLIKGILAQPTIPPQVKNAAIIKLLSGTASLSEADASILLDFAMELRTTSRNLLGIQTGDRVLTAVSVTHRDLFWARFSADWLESLTSGTVTSQDYLRDVSFITSIMKRKLATTLNEDDKLDLEKEMAILRSFAEKKCIDATPRLDYPVQSAFIAMFVALPSTRPLTTSKYIEFLVDFLAAIPIPTTPDSASQPSASKSAISLLQQCWDNGPDNVFVTMPQLFLNLSDNEKECSIGIGYLLQAIPEAYTSVVDPFIQGLDSSALWRLRFTVQRLINWLVTIDLPGIAIWIVAIMESLASRGEFMLLRELADENAYKIARQLAFKARRKDALLVLRFMLLGYHHSPVLFNNIVQGLLPLVAKCRKTSEDITFAGEINNLAQILLIHFGDTDAVSTKVQKARAFLDLPVVSRAEALQTMQENSWKKSLHIQNTSAGFRRRPAFAQPLGKVGLVNLGNSCFMNSALRALFCSTEFKQSILSDTLKVEPSKVMTTRLRETFNNLSTPRLSVVTPSALYKALPNWLNDGHQQDAAEFIKILFSQLEGEGPIPKEALSSFQGTAVNQIACGTCGTVSSNKEEFYDLTVPLPRADIAELQALVDIFPTIEKLNDENNNKYFCDKCKSLQDATRSTILESVPTNLIISLNRFEFDVVRAQRIKINTPLHLSENINIKVRDGQEAQSYSLYAVVIHTGDSANHGHYYTYARDSAAVDVVTAKDQDAATWLIYNDTRITISSFEAMQQSLERSRADTPYMLFFRKICHISPKNEVTQVIRVKRSASNL